MSRKTIVAILLNCLFAGMLFAATKPKDDNTVDSLDYDFKIEWKNYGGAVTVKAFTVQRENLWYAANNMVVVQSLKSSARRTVSTIGDLSTEEVTCMATDSSGKVWIGTPGGCAVEAGAKFTSFTTENGLSDNAVLCIVPSKSGVWVGTANGLCLYNNGAFKSYTKENGLCGNKINAAVIDYKTGAVWVGTDKGISVFTNGKWSSHTMNNGLSWNDTRALGYDPRSGYIWAAVGEKDVNCYTGKEWKVYMGILDVLGSIMCDSQSRIWCGSPENGLVKYNGDEWIYDVAKTGIPVTKVYATYRDEGGNLWFASEKGLLRVNNPYPY